jgi:hypothetical protein
MTSPAVPAGAGVDRRPLLDAVFGALWPERALPGRPRFVGAALAVGLLGAVVLPFRDAGIGSFLVLMAVCGVVAAADDRLRTPYHLVSGVLCSLLLSTLFLRDADWVIALCVLAAFGVGSAALVDGRTLTGLLASGAVVPLAGLRGMPWLRRSLTLDRRPAGWWPVLRTVLVSVVLVVVFAALFASADALFASWIDALVPDLSIGTSVLRAFVLAALAGLTLAGVYVAMNPPRVEVLALPPAQPLRRRFEWLLPVGAVVVVFAIFLGAQLTAMFGGHGYLRRTTGLTYAEYVHQGFGQLTLTTLLTLVVVVAAARKASRSSVEDRLLLRVVLGVLCALTLVVVASALYRMHVYEQAYGFTRLRLLVSFFEAWLGLVVAMVMLAGVRLRATWLPRAALISGAIALLTLAAVDPDAYIARQNVDRLEESGKVDWHYLSGLSADATPVLAELPASLRACVSAAPSDHDDWLEWNLGRARARSAEHPSELDTTASCESD